ncbi:hypothetical protein [Aeromonas tecta]|uniref:hypothetical protein n=1 Tax=Aeromonas tecta TaxID=324617 RepID=UPI000682FA72|nr:hypothetical protein [Aeromonas tecta]
MQVTRTESVNHDSHCIICFLPIIHLVLQLASLLFGIYLIQIILYLVALATVNRKSTCLTPFTGWFCGGDGLPEVLFPLTNIAGAYHLLTGYPNYCGETEPCLSSSRRRMTNPMGKPAIKGLGNTEVQNGVQNTKKGCEINNVNDVHEVMIEANKKSRHCGAALSNLSRNAQPVKADPEIVAPHYAMASKSRQAPVSKASIKGQFMLYGQTEEDRQEAMQRIEQARVNDDGLKDADDQPADPYSSMTPMQSLLAKRDLLRNRKGVKS